MTKKNSRVYFINATLSGNAHEIIDSSELIIFSKIFPQVHAYFQKSRCKAIQNTVEKFDSSIDVKFHGLFDLGKRSALNDLKAALVEIFLLLRLKKKNNLFVFSYINMFSCHILNFISKITRKKIIICCHNELEIVAERKPKMFNYWRWLVYRFYTKTNLANNVYLLVLGENIREKYAEYIDQDKLDKVISVEHPYFSASQDHVDLRYPKNKKIKIGVIGSVSKNKERGFENILHLANSLIKFPDVEIDIISKIDVDLVDKLPPNVCVVGSPGFFLPRNEYDAYVGQLDYIYSPYPMDSFVFTASGALLESLFKNKVLLMHANAYVKHLMSLFGTFGLLIDGMNSEEIYSFLKNKNHDNYLTILQDMTEKLNPEQMVPMYRMSIAECLDGKKE